MGRDPHLEGAARLLDIPLAEAQERFRKREKVICEARQHCKVQAFNSRLPRGMLEER